MKLITKFCNIINSLVYRVRILFEHYYFYHSRKVWHKWFNEENNQYEWSFDRAKEYLYRWYEGEWDLLNILELKLVHIWYKLKRDGNHLYWYIDSYNFASNKATDSDRQLFINSVKNKVDTVSSFKDLCMEEQTFIVTPQNYQMLSDYLKSKTRGQREDLKELLHLRRLIRNVKRIDGLDYKYIPTKAEQKEYDNLGKDKEELYDKYFQLYIDDRKELYRKVADYIATNGFGWWD